MVVVSSYSLGEVTSYHKTNQQEVLAAPAVAVCIHSVLSNSTDGGLEVSRLVGENCFRLCKMTYYSQQTTTNIDWINPCEALEQTFVFQTHWSPLHSFIITLGTYQTVV